jgi:putative membrane protein
MSTTVQVLAVFVAVMLAVVWVMESFLYRNPKLYPMFLTKPADFDAVRMWTVNMGFYNLTTGAAMVIGVILVNADRVPQGEALITFTAAQHVFMAVVLVVSQPRLWLNAILESAPNIAILALLLT